MPQVGKEALSQSIRTECLRLLRLNLSPDVQAFRPERTAAGMPPVQPPRPGLEYLAQAGEEWQAEKIEDLSDTFGTAVVIGDRYTNPAGRERFRAIELINYLPTAPQGCFLVEAEFEVRAAFENALGIASYRQAYGLVYSKLRPDLIEVLPPTLDINRYVSPAGEVLWLADDDSRIKLRVIDIKLTAEPSPSYFAEVTYYSMALAGWLIDRGLDNRYVVVPNAAIWPGSHDASCLVKTCREIEDQGGTPTYAQMWDAMQEDLEAVPFEVFVGRVKHFFITDLPRAFACPWQQHSWHVDNRCKGCDYLGYPWIGRNGQPTVHPLHCMPTAEQTDHLSRVAFISRGASAALSDQGIADVSALAQLQPNSVVFNAHYSLRATRHVVSGRATSLQAQQSAIPPQSGTSCVMPKYADLHIYLTVDFDLGSAITFSLGVKGFWVEPQPFGFVGQRATQAYGPHTHMIDQKDLPVERRELMAFLNNINAILMDARNRNATTTVQFYIWDSVQYKHLTRIIGRHLQDILADQTIQHLAWLFPPEELLPNPAMETRRSPITIVREVVRTLLAAPIPYYYTLFHTARAYHQASLPAQIAAFSVHPLFEDVLSDQIPSERAHEIWARVTRPRLWSDQLRTLQETVSKQLNALEAITRRLEEDLRPSLQQIAPQIRIEPPRRESGISIEGQLWYGFARLNAALGELEVHQTRAMPPDEREARYRSARMTRRLTGAAETTALAQLGITQSPRLRVYEMRPESREVKAREGDFSFALAPENMPGFLDRPLQLVTQGTPLEPPNGSGWRTYMEDVTGVRIVAIDRDAGLIALLPNNRYPTMLDDLEQQGLVNFGQDVILDPVWIDAFTRKLRETLHAIGNPPNAQGNPLVRQAMGLTSRRRGRQTPGSPAADLLWAGNMLANSVVNRNLPGIRQLLEQHGISLNQSQWVAWEASLSRRLQTVWGPPGTGKSRTLHAVALGAVVDAVQRDIPLRILVCAPTYNALDNVFLATVTAIGQIVQHPDLQCVRIRSTYRPIDPNIPNTLDLELNKAYPSQAVQQLRQRLRNNMGITVVGATPEQTHNLLVTYNDSARQEFFDFIILDEASQVDVGHAILPFAALAGDGVVVVAGDPKQLPPIHQAKGPVGLEAMVGSIYVFLEQLHHVQPAILEENYRSNRVIVELAHEAGYDRSLTSYSPDLQIDVVAPFPTAAPPSGWPQSLFWTSEWASLLEPRSPVSCFVYPEGRSSQWNPFEADSVTALAFLLYGRLGDQLLNERDPNSGGLKNASHTPYTMDDFWRRGIGIVTPHRAQQALIVARLQQVFAPLGASNQLIRDAVDTVERFQGQQRDVIVASFALGDQDAIQDEDEFLMSLNRFNVMTSRARAKLVILVTQEVVNHLSGELEVLWQSRLLKVFVESFCDNARPMTLGHVSANGVLQVDGLFKWRQ
jgi:hypothetical protein